MLYGIYATSVTRGLAFRRFPDALRQILHPPQSNRPVSPFRAFATSLGGTIGVGNLTGVSVALALGGAGAVFWMWISAFLCMTIKYFEIYLAVKHQPKEEEQYAFAPMVYLKKATESKGFAGLFALFGVFSALTMGSMIQTNAAANAAKEAFHVSPWILGGLFALLTGIVVTGGVRRITGVLEKSVPLLGALFLLTGLGAILLRYDRILPAFGSIFSQAFSFSSVSGGILGSGIVLAFRHGVGNGLFSHEAGLGSGGLAHGACGACPEQQGLWGIFEVFADTIVISTVSALVILTAQVESGANSLLSAATKTLGALGGGIIAVCLILFGLLSVFSWSYYGETCFVWICGKKSALVFRILFVLSPILGAIAGQTFLWESAEIINGCMMILNLTGLLGYRQELKKLR